MRPPPGPQPVLPRGSVPAPVIPEPCLALPWAYPGRLPSISVGAAGALPHSQEKLLLILSHSLRVPFRTSFWRMRRNQSHLKAL